MACAHVLELWKEREGVLASGAELQKLLQEAGQFNEDIAAMLKGTATTTSQSQQVEKMSKVQCEKLQHLKFQATESPVKKRKLSGNADQPKPAEAAKPQ